MNKLILFCLIAVVSILLFACEDNGTQKNKTAKLEQAETEKNQSVLLSQQPPPKLSWSLERDNLIKRTKLQNDRTVTFFMYVFIEGIADPIGYYQVNKVSSVNSQLTNPNQIINNGPYRDYGFSVLPSPAEDGSYGTNGDGVFGFTPEDIYIETNMKYVASTVPLTFTKPVNRLAIINTDQAKALLEASKAAMAKP